MSTYINESVSVDLLSNHLTGKVYPWVISWRGRRYQIKKVSFHHMTKEGKTLLHIFSVTDGTIFFKLVFNTEHLHWQLLEISE
jgi:hypothetical protein